MADRVARWRGRLYRRARLGAVPRRAGFWRFAPVAPDLSANPAGHGRGRGNRRKFGASAQRPAPRSCAGLARRMIVWNRIVRNRAALRAPVFTAVLITVNKV